jgi:hypothetical protein
MQIRRFSVSKTGHCADACGGTQLSLCRSDRGRQVARAMSVPGHMCVSRQYVLTTTWMPTAPCSGPFPSPAPGRPTPPVPSEACSPTLSCTRSCVYCCNLYTYVHTPLPCEYRILPLHPVTREPQCAHMLVDSTSIRGGVTEGQESYSYPLLRNRLLNMFRKLMLYLGLGSFNVQFTVIQR